MSTPRIVMVVDDDAELRETVCMVLSRDGLVAVEAADGAEALAMLSRGTSRPSLILLDLMMPGMNGWEFCDERSRVPELAAIPVVAFTAGRDPARHPSSIAEVLLKPMNLKELLGVVRRYVPPSPS